ncbi:MAG: acyl-ACP--UDP-N-acetylglucosamine O-acyltransferase [Candidatus Didemnitutus sp.]|nr:acyl-ACP--UDP-N-acetylglucosamine O-acyltransferase [Candidatus Didemnitutus sp.]
MIHPTALVEPGAQLGANCVIHAYAVVTKYCVLGAGVVVHPFAVVGSEPNFLKFDPAIATGVRIGAGTVLREHSSINRSIYAGKETVVGARCFLMANAHVGHDCEVGDDVVMATNVMLGGHVSIGDFTFIGGGAGVHQFARLGEGVMVAGLARITQDIAPFLMVAERNEVPGFNLVGMKRRGVSREAIKELKACYARVFAGGDPRAHAKTVISAGVQSDEARRFLEFFAGGKRGFARPDGRASSDET